MQKIVKTLTQLGVIGTLLLALTAFTPVKINATGSDPLAVRITQVNTSQFPRVTVYVSVTDANGNPVEVSPSRLVLTENGKTMEPEEIKGVGDVESSLTTLLVMDVSGSMNAAGKLDSAKDAATAYIKQMRPNDQGGLLSFNTKITYVQPVTSDHTTLLIAVNRLAAKDDTAMYDALIEGIRLLESTSGRKAIIALTDGMDNRSKANPKKVIDRIGPAGLSISTIGLGDPQYSRGNLAGLDEAVLTYIAEHAGGVYGYANDAGSLTRLYERYGRALQSEYAITYTSPAALRDGVNRSLEVVLREGGGAQTEGEVYNPGGLVPEVAQPASWLVFAGLLVGLLLLLSLPLLIPRLVPHVAKARPGRIKLLDQKKPKPKIKLKR